MPAYISALTTEQAATISVSGLTSSYAYVEANRAADFSSDDSTYFDCAAPNNGNSSASVTGLASGTTWYFRVIENNGLVSNTAMRATLPITATAAYSGFSIDKALVVVPEPIIAYGIGDVTTGGATAFPLSNLLSDDPTSTMRSAGPGSFYMDFDTSGAPIDTIAILGTNANDEVTWSIRGDMEPGQRGNASTVFVGGQFRCSPTIGPRRSYHGLLQLPAPVQARAWRIYIDSKTAFIARHLVLGLARKSVNASRGHSTAMNDRGTFDRTRFGIPDRVTGWRGRTVDFDLSWLSEAEYQTKYATLPIEVGKTRPVLAIPNSKRNIYLNDRIAYGTITEMRGENPQSFKFNAGMTIDSLY